MNDAAARATVVEVAEAFVDVLGAERVVTNAPALADEQRNLTEFPARRLGGILRPADKDGVVAALAVARRFGVALHPFSTGRNWGLGSRVPTCDDGYLLDLGDLNAIRAIDTGHRYAVIEPGVTQKMLADALQDTECELMVHVTGSHEDTSIIGNCLDRGIGYFGARVSGIRGLEVVLADGTTVRTGHWRMGERSDGGALSHCYAHGLGPDLTGLFCQSNLGVVTAMVFDLMPRRPFVAALLRFREADLAAVIDGLAELRTEEVISEGFEIDNDLDPRVDGLGLTTGSAERQWAVWMRLPGSERQIAVAKHRILRRLGRTCLRIDFFNPDDPSTLEGDPVFAALCDRWNGRPGNFSVAAMAQASGVETDGSNFNPDHEPAVSGFVCTLPALPFAGADVTEALALVESISAKHGVSAALTLSGLSTIALEGFFRVYFDRADEAAVATAHRWNSELHDALAAAGIHPYRISIAEMPRYFETQNDPYLDALAKIKSALDPQGIIAPGRYAPIHRNRRGGSDHE